MALIDDTRIEHDVMPLASFERASQPSLHPDLDLFHVLRECDYVSVPGFSEADATHRVASQEGLETHTKGQLAFPGLVLRAANGQRLLSVASYHKARVYPHAVSMAEEPAPIKPVPAFQNSDVLFKVTERAMPNTTWTYRGFGVNPDLVVSE